MFAGFLRSLRGEIASEPGSPGERNIVWIIYQSGCVWA